jgi:hypothetical protein
MSAEVQNARSRVVRRCEMIEIMGWRSGGEILISFVSVRTIKGRSS